MKLSAYAATTILLLTACTYSNESLSNLQNKNATQLPPPKSSCDGEADAYARRDKKYRQFIDLLRAGLNDEPSSARNMITTSIEDTTYIEILVAIGKRNQLESLWSAVEHSITSNPDEDWKWNLPAIAVLCSNQESAKYIFSLGYDVNIERPNLVDLMTTTIFNRDAEMSAMLFEFGYKKCNRETKRGETLPELAKRVGFDDFLPLYNKNCSTILQKLEPTSSAQGSE